MEEIQIDLKEHVLVAGDGRLACSVAVCLLQGGHAVDLYTKNEYDALKRIDTYLRDLQQYAPGKRPNEALRVTPKPRSKTAYEAGIIIAEEDLAKKRRLVGDLEKYLQPDAVIAVNTESIPLERIQENTGNPGRIVGLNWTEPAHTTLFQELIVNEAVEQKYIDRLFCLSTQRWHKDPYVVSGGYGIRSRLLSALAREAFYLVENGYASIEDIDRACRNDGGYYLPFAGSCRYMDLMGAYAYGVVMKDLNPDLSAAEKPPDLFEKILAEGGKGMMSGKGFYSYQAGDAEVWDKKFRKFSYQIKEIINKYPFNDKHDGASGDKKQDDKWKRREP